MTAGPEHIAEAVRRLQRGGLVAFPTETVYGLGADAFSAEAVARVFAVKGRPGFNPLIIHVSGETMARRVAGDWPADAARLARALWPGPLTIVVARSMNLPDIVTAGGPTVAIRCPDHHITLALLEAFGGPLVGPSANPSGRISPTTAEHVREAFTEDQVYVLDGGPCRGGIESTVVTLVPPAQRPADAPAARILRAGPIGAAEIERVLGRPVGQAPERPMTGSAPRASPGQLETHYAPATPAAVFDADGWRALQSRGRLAVLTHTGINVPPPHRAIPMPAAAPAYAARLYAALREADALGADLIAIERPPAADSSPDGAIWAAVADRLARATGLSPR